MYFQSSKSIRTNRDVGLPLWLTWMFTSGWFFKSQSVSSGHVLLFKNIQLPGSENIPSVHQQEKCLWNRLKSEKFSLVSFAFPVKVCMCKISDKLNPPPQTTQTQLYVSRGPDMSDWKFWLELGEHLTNFYEPVAPLSFIQSCIFIQYNNSLTISSRRKGIVRTFYEVSCITRLPCHTLILDTIDRPLWRTIHSLMINLRHNTAERQWLLMETPTQRAVY